MMLGIEMDLFTHQHLIRNFCSLIDVLCHGSNMADVTLIDIILTNRYAQRSFFVWLDKESLFLYY